MEADSWYRSEYLYQDTCLELGLWCLSSAPPPMQSVGYNTKIDRTRRGTGAIQQKITQYARGCLYSKKSETPDDELPEARNM